MNYIIRIKVAKLIRKSACSHEYEVNFKLDKKVIEYAKDFAQKNGISLSELVENYFKHLTSNEINKEITSLSPKVKKLKGIIKVESGFDHIQVLKDELSRKYGV